MSHSNQTTSGQWTVYRSIWMADSCTLIKELVETLKQTPSVGCWSAITHFDAWVMSSEFGKLCLLHWFQHDLQLQNIRSTVWSFQIISGSFLSVEISHKGRGEVHAYLRLCLTLHFQSCINDLSWFKKDGCPLWCLHPSEAERINQILVGWRGKPCFGCKTITKDLYQ